MNDYLAMLITHQIISSNLAMWLPIINYKHQSRISITNCKQRTRISIVPFEILVWMARAWKKEVFSGPREVFWAGTVTSRGAMTPALAGAATLFSWMTLRTSDSSPLVKTRPTFPLMNGSSLKCQRKHVLWLQHLKAPHVHNSSSRHTKGAGNSLVVKVQDCQPTSHGSISLLQTWTRRSRNSSQFLFRLHLLMPQPNLVPLHTSVTLSGTNSLPWPAHCFKWGASLHYRAA